MTTSKEERAKLELRRAGVVELLHTVADEIHDLAAKDFAKILGPLQKAIDALMKAARGALRVPRGGRSGRPKVGK